MLYNMAASQWVNLIKAACTMWKSRRCGCPCSFSVRDCTKNCQWLLTLALHFKRLPIFSVPNSVRILHRVTGRPHQSLTRSAQILLLSCCLLTCLMFSTSVLNILIHLDLIHEALLFYAISVPYSNHCVDCLQQCKPGTCHRMANFRKLNVGNMAA